MGATLKRALEVGLTKTAKAAWPVFQAINKVIPEGKGFTPKWSNAPLTKSYQKVKPPLGWPRETDSLCPECVKEIRGKILSGEQSVDILRNEKPAEIKAKIIERDGKIWMVKECPRHGKFEDVMAIDPKFLQRMEKLYPGSDFYAPHKIRQHGSSSLKYGRGAVMTIDLTNRCNMMCDPCFMDANQVGYVHELTFDEVKKILDDAISVKPKRQMSIQYSGGEPTISPHFIDAIKYAKEVGFFSVQCATNGIKFAEDPKFAKEAYDAGLRIAYLQFDGVGNDNNAHRKIGNLFDVKLRAMNNLYNAGVDIVLVVTIVNTVNDHQVGDIVRFAIENGDKISFISFQPVSFTGRDEDITPEDRHRQRYTLSHLAHDVKKQTGLTDPLRDWFPLSAIAPFSDFTDMMKGADQDWGALKCGCHPNCGVGTVLLVDKHNKTATPMGEMFNLEQFLEDVKVINDSARGNKMSMAQMSMALLKNYNPKKAPQDFNLQALIKKFDKQSGGSYGGEYGEGKERKKDRWLFLFVAGMWFQDLWNYDFRRTERCIIPYGTQEGEISFCAYNTGVGWRNIVENMHKVSSVGKWYKEKGRHPVYANGKSVELPSFDHDLKVNGEDYDASAQARSDGKLSPEPEQAKVANGFAV